jgi:hypothetical protein
MLIRGIRGGNDVTPIALPSISVGVFQGAKKRPSLMVNVLTNRFILISIIQR